MGAKRALELSKQVAAVNQRAEGAVKLTEATFKRTKRAAEMLLIDKQQSMIALFSMPGTNAALETRFVQLSQKKALASLEGEVADHNVIVSAAERIPLFAPINSYYCSKSIVLQGDCRGLPRCSQFKIFVISL